MEQDVAIEFQKLQDGQKRQTEILGDIKKFQESCSTKQETRYEDLKEEQGKAEGNIALIERDVKTAHVRIDKVDIKFWAIILSILGIAAFIIRQGLIE